jgi:hypothetical protein
MRKKQDIFPLLLEGEEDRKRIQALARHLRGSQSEALRRIIQIAHEALVTQHPTEQQQWLLAEVEDRIKQAWER